MRKSNRTLTEELDLAAARIQALHAQLGRIPTALEYNTASPTNIAPGARTTTFFLRHSIRYSDLCARAGYTPRRPGIKSNTNTNADGIPTDVETEIVAALAAGDHQLYREWPIVAIPTKTETREIPQPDGTIYRITRTYASLR